jgi:general secretion pathway protein F
LDLGFGLLVIGVDMPVFQYSALDKDGNAVTGVLDADSPREAREKLRIRRVFVSEISMAAAAPSGSKEAPWWKAFLPKGRGKSRAEISTVTRQISTLLGAGMPITEAMNAVIEQTQSRRIETVLRDIREKLASGASFADALETHPRYFTDLYINMVRAGEASGNLDEVLHRVAEFLQRQNRLHNKVTAALTYPLVLVCVGMLVVFILLKFAVPKILTVLESSNQVLPWPTKVLVGVSNFVQNYWIFIGMGIVGAIGVWLAMGKSDRIGLWMDRMKLKIPVFGDLFRKTSVARFAITLATLLRSGVTILDGLGIVQKVVDNRVLAHTLGRVRKLVLEGADFSTPVKKSGVFPPVVGYMIAIGEESGQMETMLDRISEAYEEEVEISTQRLMALLEPIIIVLLAFVVGFIVAAIIWPILKMSSIR